MIRMTDLIAEKRDGGMLDAGEIREMVDGYTRGEIPDYQASALCMAICLKGMTDRETWLLTDAMMHSGDTVDLSAFGNLSVDKHSTGGVGDKVSPVVGPVIKRRSPTLKVEASTLTSATPIREKYFVTRPTSCFLSVEFEP